MHSGKKTFEHLFYMTMEEGGNVYWTRFRTEIAGRLIEPDNRIDPEFRFGRMRLVDCASRTFKVELELGGIYVIKGLLPR